MQRPLKRSASPTPSPKPARDGGHPPRPGSWHDLGSVLVDAVAGGTGPDVEAHVVAHAAGKTGLSPAGIRDIMAASRYVRGSRHEGPVLATVEAVLSLGRIASVHPALAARLLDGVMAGQANLHGLAPEERPSEPQAEDRHRTLPVPASPPVRREPTRTSLH